MKVFPVPGALRCTNIIILGNYEINMIEMTMHLSKCLVNVVTSHTNCNLIPLKNCIFWYPQSLFMNIITIFLYSFFCYFLVVNRCKTVSFTVYEIKHDYS